MRIHSKACAAAMGLLLVAGGCSRNPEPEETPDVAADTAVTDTARVEGEAENPPGYRGMERDTTMMPPGGRADTTQGVYDTLDYRRQRDTTGVSGQQGQQQNPPGYRGMERDTTVFPYRDTTNQGDTTGVSGQQGQYPQDTTGYQPQDTAGYQQPDTTGGWMQHDTTGGRMQHDTTGMSDTSSIGRDSL
ncbi:MAG TPA: hypothetical protein VNK43_13335 [Gemmatimonadales bacterium]|nr:hypothetical protein [Gemmatimonadales bacterium]